MGQPWWREGVIGGVQRQDKNVYRNVHCYAHQLNLVMQQATPHNPRIGNFFFRPGWIFCAFFWSAKQTTVLDQVVAHRLPGTLSTWWNFLREAVELRARAQAQLPEVFPDHQRMWKLWLWNCERGRWLCESAGMWGHVFFPGTVSQHHATCGHAV